MNWFLWVLNWGRLRRDDIYISIVVRCGFYPFTWRQVARWPIPSCRRIPDRSVAMPIVCTDSNKRVKLHKSKLIFIVSSSTPLPPLTWPLNEPKRRQTSWPFVFEFIVRIINANPYVISNGQQKVQNQCNNWRPEPAVQQFNQASLKCKCAWVKKSIKYRHHYTAARHNKTQTLVPGTHTLNTSQKRT